MLGTAWVVSGSSFKSVESGNTSKLVESVINPKESESSIIKVLSLSIICSNSFMSLSSNLLVSTTNLKKAERDNQQEEWPDI